MIYIIVFLSFVSVILVFVLGFKENRIRSLEMDIDHQKNSLEVISKEYNDLYEESTEINNKYKKINQLAGLYRERYGILKEEDLEIIRNNRKESGDEVD